MVEQGFFERVINPIFFLYSQLAPYYAKLPLVHDVEVSLFVSYSVIVKLANSRSLQASETETLNFSYGSRQKQA